MKIIVKCECGVNHTYNYYMIIISFYNNKYLMFTAPTHFCCLQFIKLSIFCSLLLFQLHSLWPYILCQQQTALHMQNKILWELGVLRWHERSTMPRKWPVPTQCTTRIAFMFNFKVLIAPKTKPL